MAREPRQTADSASCGVPCSWRSIQQPPTWLRVLLSPALRPRVGKEWVYIYLSDVGGRASSQSVRAGRHPAVGWRGACQQTESSVYLCLLVAVDWGPPHSQVASHWLTSACSLTVCELPHFALGCTRCCHLLRYILASGCSVYILCSVTTVTRNHPTFHGQVTCV